MVHKHKSGHVSPKKQLDEILKPIIKKIFFASREEYGARSIRFELEKQGHIVGRTRIARLMKALKLIPKARRKFKVTTQQAQKPYHVAPNRLDQKFSAQKPNQVWVSDITYVPTREGWLYVATVLDLFSRKIVGLAMSQRLSKELVLRAVKQAITRRKPQPGLILHSDRGSQYTSKAYAKLAKKHGVLLSMSATGNCYDNAVAESFFHTLKIGIVHDHNYLTRNQATRAIFEYIEVFYNTQRRHSTIGYLTPTEYEAKYQSKITNQPCLLKA